jgi:nicotinamide-nucleotide amidase
MNAGKKKTGGAPGIVGAEGSGGEGQKGRSPGVRLAEAVLRGGRAEGLTIAVAESCTGGLISSMITDVPGSSGYFLGSVVAYADETKKKLLGVNRCSLKRYGAVSEHVAAEMARGVSERLSSDIGLSVTGIAGPGGGSEQKPVGTVYIGISVKDRSFVKGFRFEGTRRSIKKQSATSALNALSKFLEGIDP